jgi:transcriptional regulator with XRE-family HTH domain
MLKELRLKNDLTQMQLAEKLNVKQSTVSMWESGSVKPPLNKISALASALNVSTGEIVSYILGDTANEF